MTTYGYSARPSTTKVGSSVRGADERKPIGPRGTGGSFSASRLADAFTLMFPDGWIEAKHIVAGTITADEIATGTLTADLLDVSELSAITADVGTLNAGIIQNNVTPAPTAGIRLDSSSSIGAGWNTYLDLAATGSDPVLYHTTFTLSADGTAVFSGALSAASGSFSGTVSSGATIAAESFTGGNLVITGDISIYGGAAGPTVLIYQSGGYGGLSIGNTYSDPDFYFEDASSGVLRLSALGAGTKYFDMQLSAIIAGDLELDGAFNHDGASVGFYGTAPIAQKTGYTTFSNLSTDRTCDADSTTTAELADILGTLIEDLKAYGLLGA